MREILGDLLKKGLVPFFWDYFIIAFREMDLYFF